MDFSANKKWTFIAALLIAIAILFGAIGAHALDNFQAISSKNIESWKTGVLYQLVQGVGLLCVIILFNFFKIKQYKFILNLFFVGTLVFSFSIYILVLNAIWQIQWLKFSMIPLTPIGGVLMIFGWVLVAFKIVKQK